MDSGNSRKVVRYHPKDLNLGRRREIVINSEASWCVCLSVPGWFLNRGSAVLSVSVLPCLPRLEGYLGPVCAPSISAPRVLPSLLALIYADRAVRSALHGVLSWRQFLWLYRVYGVRKSVVLEPNISNPHVYSIFSFESLRKWAHWSQPRWLSPVDLPSRGLKKRGAPRSKLNAEISSFQECRLF